MSAINLSTAGHAHYSHISDVPGSVGGMMDDPMRPINRLLDSVHKTASTNGIYKIPYYGPSHICDIDLACKYFYKVILITYLPKDILEIAKIFVVKWWIETINGKGSQIHKILVEHIKLLKSSVPIFSTPIELGNSVLCITWDELLRGPETELILKLHNFTHIPINQFSIANLIVWRERTHQASKQLDLLYKNKEI
jgi:hypothetical protein